MIVRIVFSAAVAIMAMTSIAAAQQPTPPQTIKRTLLQKFDVPGSNYETVIGLAEIVPNVNKLAAAVRRTGGKVFWIRQTVDDDSAVAWSEWLGMMTPATRRNLVANLAPGSRGHEIYPDLEVKPEDEVVQKYRFSAFVQGASDLPQRLRAQGYDTVLITGTVTNVCCESSARDAMMLNFKTIMVSDANAARTDEEHNATLSTFLAIFGDVMDTDFLIQRLETNAALRVAAE